MIEWMSSISSNDYPVLEQLEEWLSILHSASVYKRLSTGNRRPNPLNLRKCKRQLYGLIGLEKEAVDADADGFIFSFEALHLVFIPLISFQKQGSKPRIWVAGWHWQHIARITYDWLPEDTINCSHMPLKFKAKLMLPLSRRHFLKCA